jgi:beta-N-acetylhexosaminidase
VGVGAHRALADEVAERSMTLVRDRDALLPPDPARLRRVVSVTWAEARDLTAGREFDAMLALLPGAVESVRVGPDTPDGVLEELRGQPRGADRVLLNVYLPPRAGAGSVALPAPFRAFAAEVARNHPTVLVSLGNPYLLAAVPEVGSYLVAWGDREVSQRAAARAVLGAAPIRGGSPFRFPPSTPRGGARARCRPGDGGPGRGPGRRPGRGGAPPPRRPGARPRRPGPPPPAAWDTLPVSPLELADPREVGMDPAALAALDAYIEAAIGDSVAPGVALAVGRRGRLVRLRGYGTLDWAPGSPPVTPSTLFDLASLTKVVGTTSAVMLLADEGRLALDDPVVRHLPGWDRGDPRKSGVTIRDLLLHRAAFPPSASTS